MAQARFAGLSESSGAPGQLEAVGLTGLGAWLGSTLPGLSEQPPQPTHAPLPHDVRIMTYDDHDPAKTSKLGLGRALRLLVHPGGRCRVTGPGWGCPGPLRTSQRLPGHGNLGQAFAPEAAPRQRLLPTEAAPRDGAGSALGGVGGRTASEERPQAVAVEVRAKADPKSELSSWMAALPEQLPVSQVGSPVKAFSFLSP